MTSQLCNEMNHAQYGNNDIITKLRYDMLIIHATNKIAVKVTTKIKYIHKI